MSEEEDKENGIVLISQVSDSVKLMNPVISALTTPITVNSTPIFSSVLALPNRFCLKTVE